MRYFNGMFKVLIVAASATVSLLLPADLKQADACIVAIVQEDKCTYINIGSAGLECGSNTVRLGVSDEGRDDCNAIDVQVEVEDPSILSFGTTSFSFPDGAELPDGITRSCSARLTEVEVIGLKAGKTKINYYRRPLGYTDREFELKNTQNVEVRCSETTTTTVPTESTTTTTAATDLTVDDLTLLIEGAMLNEEIAYNELKEAIDLGDTSESAIISKLQEAGAQLEEANSLLLAAAELARQLRDASQITISTAYIARGLLARAELYDRISLRSINFNINAFQNGTTDSRTNLRLSRTARLTQEAYQTNQAALETIAADTALE
ncbi:hypothetical protein ACFL43_06880 [Thermodesulfobacteriota bacterium]